MANNDKILLVVTIIGVVSFFIYKKIREHTNAYNNQTECRTEFKKEVSGIIAKAFFDEDPAHKGFVTEFKDGNVYRPLYLLKKLEAANLYTGDSLYKKAGSFKFFIFKNGAEIPLIIEDTVNCDTVE